MCYGAAISLSAFCSCPKILPETEIKGIELINLAKEISRQSNIEVVAWLLLETFSQTYIANPEQRDHQDDLKHYESSQE